ncbi:MAG TPA: hypothetical protein VF860_00440, partial [Candidatus Acidoferrales bacterium]
RDFANQLVEMAVKMGTAVEDAARLRQKKWFVLQIKAFNHPLDETCELFGRGSQEAPSGLVALICGFRNDGENFRQDAVGMGANLGLQLNPIAFECIENLVRKIGILPSTALRQTEDHRLSADIVGASRITEHRTEPSFTGKGTAGISADHSGTGSGYGHETRRFPGCGKGHAQVSVYKNGSARELDL